MKHTPGPWHCVCDDGYWYIYGSNDFQIDNTFNSTQPKTVEANRTLIESAPDLLEACKLAETWFSGSVLSPMEQTIVKKLRAAIEKAEPSAS